MIPTKEEAFRLLAEAQACNPDPWENHSRIAAHCARCIAKACGMDPEKAYVLGLLHDIGRRHGRGHLRHVYDGWKDMMDLGYDEVARICLTHSFHHPSTQGYIGQFDVTEGELTQLEGALREAEQDDFDRLIQLCDAMAGSEGVLDVQERMADVKRRYGSYPQEKWDYTMGLKAYFEEKTGRNLTVLVEQDGEG